MAGKELAERYGLACEDLREIITIGAEIYGLSEGVATNAVRVVLGAVHGHTEYTSKTEQKELSSDQAKDFLQVAAGFLQSDHKIYVA